MLLNITQPAQDEIKMELAEKTKIKAEVKHL